MVGVASLHAKVKVMADKREFSSPLCVLSQAGVGGEEE